MLLLDLQSLTNYVQANFLDKNCNSFKTFHSFILLKANRKMSGSMRKKERLFTVNKQSKITEHGVKQIGAKHKGSIKVHTFLFLKRYVSLVATSIKWP